MRQDKGVPASPSGCQPSASALRASQSGIPNAEVVAKALTEAQRDKLLYGYFPIIGWANVSVNGHPTHIPELAAMGLLERDTDIDGKPHFCSFKATPLGLAVRALIARKTSTEAASDV